MTAHLGLRLEALRAHAAVVRRRASSEASITLSSLPELTVLLDEACETAELCARLADRLETESLVSTIAAQVLEWPIAAGVDAGIMHLLATLGTAAGADRAYLVRFSVDGERLTCAHEWCANGVAPQALWDIPSQALPWLFENLRRPSVVHVPRVGDLPIEAEPEKAAFEARGARSLVHLPVLWDEAVLGYFGFDALRAEKTWSEQEITRLGIAGRIVGRALRREEGERALRERLEWYQRLAELSPVGIFGTDGEGRCYYVNERWCGIAGLQRAEAQGWGWASALHAEDRPRVLAAWSGAVRAKAPFREEYRFVRPDGKTTWVLGQGTPQQEATGYIATITDITEHKRAEEEFRTAKEAAELATDSRNEFMAMVSHELKTPINSVIGYTELLLDGVEGPLTDEQGKCLVRVQKSATHLLRLVDDILDLSKMVADRRAIRPLEVHAVSFRLGECLEDTLQAFIPRIEAKALSLNGLVTPGVPDDLIGDPDRLRQVLTNLIDNAVKFTERGKIEVSVAKETPRIESAGRACLHFVVRDTGIGIPATKQAAIFKPFVQADSSNTRKYQGIGLGLAICLELVERMEGRIWVESRSGEGSAFHFTACFSIPPPRLEESGRPVGLHWAQQVLPFK